MDEQIDTRYKAVIQEQDHQSKIAKTYTSQTQRDTNELVLAAKSQVMSAESIYKACQIAKEDQQEAIKIFAQGSFLDDDIMKHYVDLTKSVNSLSYMVNLRKLKKATKTKHGKNDATTTTSRHHHRRVGGADRDRRPRKRIKRKVVVSRPSLQKERERKPQDPPGNLCHGLLHKI